MALLLPLPRAYVDWTMPPDDCGHGLGACDAESEYRNYLNWLADYLYRTDIPVPECQRKTLEEFESKKSIESAMIELSDALGYSATYVEFLELQISQGASYAVVHAAEVQQWSESTDEIRAEYGDPEIEYFISEADFDRLAREAVESEKVPPGITSADIPYRPILAKLLKEVPSKEERVAHLDLYFKNYGDCASK